MAMAYWNIVLKGRFRFLDVWNRFLKVINYFRTCRHSKKPGLVICSRFSDDQYSGAAAEITMS
jgi:hypothetical protein